MPASSRDRQRLGERGAAAGEVGTGDRAADAREVAGDLASDVAAVEIVEPGMGEMIQRRGQRRLPERLAGIGRLAVDQECRREAGRVLELGELFRREAGLTAADDVAAARVADRGGQQVGERQTPAVRLCNFERQHPTRDRARHRERRERTARRDRFEVAVELARRIGARASGRHHRAHASRPLAHEPEAVAAAWLMCG